MNFITETWAALAKTRRLLPMLMMAASLLFTEYMMSGSVEWMAALGLFVLAFGLLLPLIWRWVAASQSALSLGLYGITSMGLVILLTVVAPLFIAEPPYVAPLPAAGAIFVLVNIGGWILARDIDLSLGLMSAKSKNIELARLSEDARLLALRNHLDPHFLFNTLSAIAEWCREDPLVAEEATLALARMLRTVFDGIRAPLWPLERELDVLIALHRLHALRDDERYQLDADFCQPLPSAQVPPLILLPLFENAITHGAGAGHAGTMTLTVSNDSENVVVRIWNPGSFEGADSEGTGIPTTERRLELAFGQQTMLTIRSKPNEGTAGTETRVQFPILEGRA